MNDYIQVLTAIGGTLAVFSTAVGALWAYTRYVVERGLVPPARMDVTLRSFGTLDRKQRVDHASDEVQLVEVRIDLENLGSSVLVVSSIWVDLHCVVGCGPVKHFEDDWRKLGRVNFGKSVLPRFTGKLQDVDPRAGTEDELPMGVPVVPHVTFVNPGVTQAYTYVTTLPAEARFALVRAQFRYAIHASDAQEITLSLAKQLGLTNFTLANMSKPHTCERVFALGDEQGKQGTDVASAPSTG